MQIYPLSKNAHESSLLLRWPGLCILVDCPIDIMPTLNFLPAPLVHNFVFSAQAFVQKWQDCADLKVHQDRVFIDSLPLVSSPTLGSVSIEDIDAVLISNSASLSGLPFLSEQAGFRATVYATDPTVQLGRLIMEELLEIYERIATYESRKWVNTEKYKPLVCGTNTDIKSWRKMYTREEMNSCLKKVQLVAFKEITHLHGLLRLTACSSGYSIGSVNWILQTDYHKLVYISGTSSVTAHPSALDLTLLHDAHLAIVTNITQCPTQFPKKMLLELCTAVMTTLRNGGSVVLPCSPTGILYDLFEILGAHLDENQSLSQVPMYFVSPVGESTLAYANVFAEWLSEGKQSKVFVPEEPFTHGVYVKDGRLKCYPAVYKNLCRDLRTPCIVFAGHPCLRFGDVIELIQLWRDDPKCALILTDPAYDTNRLLAPYQPMQMQVIHLPIETRIDFTGVHRLLNELQPKTVVVSEKFAKPPENMDNRHDLTVKWDSMITYSDRTINIELESPFVKVKLDPSLAGSLNMVQLTPTLNGCSLSGYLSCYDNKFELKPVDYEKENEKCPKPPLPPPILGGVMHQNELVNALNTANLETKVETMTDQYTFAISVANFATIQVNSGYSTDVKFTTNCDQATRRKIKDAISSCLLVL